MNVPMTALARQIYGGRRLSINDPFEAETNEDADDLVALHMAKRVPAAAPGAPVSIPEVTREIGSASTATDADQAEATATTQPATANPGYNRRDVKPGHQNNKHRR